MICSALSSCSSAISIMTAECPFILREPDWELPPKKSSIGETLRASSAGRRKCVPAFLPMRVILGGVLPSRPVISPALISTYCQIGGISLIVHFGERYEPDRTSYCSGCLPGRLAGQ